MLFLNAKRTTEILKKTLTKTKSFRFSGSTAFINNYEEKCVLCNGKVLNLASGTLAKFADGSATVTFNNTTILATAVSKTSTSSASFVPLTVVYQHKAAALGRIPINFLRREIGQTEYEILTSRLIDRSIRPLFPAGFNWDTQIICSPRAVDNETLPDVLSINAASAALAVSDIPWNGPVAAVRVAMKENEVFVMPTKQELAESKLNLVVASKSNKVIIMLEGSADKILLNYLSKAVNEGAKVCNVIINAINNLRLKCGKIKRNFELPVLDKEIESKVQSLAGESLKQIFQNYSFDKTSRDEAIKKLHDSVLNKLESSMDSLKKLEASELFYKLSKQVFRDLILETSTRCDGRGLEDIRPIYCKVDLYPPLHGSALFQRGQTQVSVTVALDSPNSAMKMDLITMLSSGLKEKNFFVHYHFPPFATNEVGRLGPMSRREIGHGNLAEKALRELVPKNYEFTIRLSSEVLESNGSSSMATVCGGSMALMDAGIPISEHCAGVAMGIITKYSGNTSIEFKDYKILTDILGIEDYLGDMDFKVAGTEKAFTAIQMDLKNEGLPIDIIILILNQAKRALKKIIFSMKSEIKSHRVDNTEKWPVVKKIVVPPESRSLFLGRGGFNIKKLELDTGVEITEESPGLFSIFATNQKIMDDVLKEIEILIHPVEKELEFGGVYSATIVEIKSKGCMVTLYPNMTPAMIPMSQLDQRLVSHPEALGLKVGDEIRVKYFGRDPISGAMRISRKVLQGPITEITQKFKKKKIQIVESQEQ